MGRAVSSLHSSGWQLLGERLTTKKPSEIRATRLWTGLFSVQADGAGKKGSIAAAAREKQPIWMAMGNGEPL